MCLLWDSNYVAGVGGDYTTMNCDNRSTVHHRVNVCNCVYVLHYLGRGRGPVSPTSRLWTPEVRRCERRAELRWGRGEVASNSALINLYSGSVCRIVKTR